MSARHTRHSPLRCWPLAAAATLIACSRPDVTPGADSVPERADSVALATTPSSTWATELGLVLVVPSDNEGTGVVLFPEAPSARLMSSSALTLLGANGDSALTRAALAVSDSQVCGEAPTVRFSDPVLASWSVGLLGKSVTPLRMDSIQALPPADSSRITSDLVRLASTIPMDEMSRFKGLPFVVMAARRFESRGTATLVAHLVRRLPQEAAPLEEHTFLIAERSLASGIPAAWDLRYHQRSEGSEETADHFEALSAVQGRETTLLLMARYKDAQTTYEVLERDRSGAWRSRWQRVLSC